MADFSHRERGLIVGFTPRERKFTPSPLRGEGWDEGNKKRVIIIPNISIQVGRYAGSAIKVVFSNN